MSAPIAPVFPASPLRFGDTLATTMRLFYRHVGLWLGLLALPVVGNVVATFGMMAAALFAVIAVLIVVSGGPAVSGINPFDEIAAAAPELIGAAVVLLVLSFVVVLFSGRLYAAISVAVKQVAYDERPSFGQAWSATRGMQWRLLPLLLLLFGITVILLGLVVVVVIVVMGEAAARSSDAALGAFGLLGLLGAFLYFVASLAVLALRTKFYYLLPAMANEGLGPMAGLRRSWQLTKGEFWRTLGYLLLIAVANGFLFSIPQSIPSMVFFPAVDTSDELDVLNLLVSNVGMWLFYLLVAVASFVSFALAGVLQAVLYVDRVRRERGEVLPPAYPVGGYRPAGPGGYSAPGYSPQATPGYPAQPAPGYQPQPVPGYPAQPAPGYQPQADPGAPPAGLGDSAEASAYQPQQPSFEAPPEEPPGRPDFYPPSE